MKVGDLLNKIANGEEVPKRVLYNEETYSYVERNRLFAKYIKEPFNARIPYYLFTDVKNIYDEVEIIEDKPFNKRVEEIYNRHIDYIYDKENKKIEKIDVAWQNVFDEQAQQDCTKMILNKINEIIDYLEEK